MVQCLISLTTPDRKGELADIVLGYDSLEQWMDNPTFFACLVGRIGNRIAKGKFKIDGKEFQLAINNGENHLHGGPTGFHKRLWAGEIEGDKVRLRYVSADMEEGFPGELTVTVWYSLAADGSLEIEYHATTDKPTIVNLTNHSYFNLAGAGSGDILAHEIESPCRAYLPVDEGCIPKGGIASTEGTAFDFSSRIPLGTRMYDADVNGYDHNLCVNRVGKKDGELAEVATVYEPTTGRTLSCSTTEPGCQLYCGGFLDGTNIGREGKPYVRHAGFCLETQKYPDAINQNFKTTLLRPDEVYSSKTVYTFGTF